MRRVLFAIVFVLVMVSLVSCSQEQKPSNHEDLRAAATFTINVVDTNLNASWTGNRNSYSDFSTISLYKPSGCTYDAVQYSLSGFPTSNASYWFASNSGTIPTGTDTIYVNKYNNTVKGTYNVTLSAKLVTNGSSCKNLTASDTFKLTLQ
ncbi:MAG: hypothetical protein ACRCYY_03270 [Trueperaceae bacterium]